jgi:hypothetical protein
MDAPPVVFGKVKSVDTSAKTIKLNIGRSGRLCIVHVDDGASIRAEKTVSASDLKVGDRIEVRGIPTGISASSIIDGDVREALPPPPGGGPDDMQGPDEGGPGGGSGPSRHHGPPNMASAGGKVTSVDPLTIEVGNDVSVVVKVGANAKVRKIVSEQLSDIKPGDRVMASGDRGDDGLLDADKVAVNIQMPPPPPGMGGPGGQGFGGPGMGGPGFGGRGRRGRGGFGGPQMGDNGPGGPGGGPGFGPGGDGPGGGPGMGPDDNGYGTGPQGPRFGQRQQRSQWGGPNDGGPGGPGGPGGFGPGQDGPGGQGGPGGPNGDDAPPPPDMGDIQS